MSNTRIERDSMGEMTVPADALYGASTARAVENFPIAKRPVPAAVIHAFGHLKAACAQANLDLGKLDERRARAIIAASDEVARGEHDAHFPVDVYQTGSGTSTNMNANEVIAHLANAKLGLGVGAGGNDDAGGAVHPNDHVNMGQSSNDTFPTAMHIAAAMMLHRPFHWSLGQLHRELQMRSGEWDHVVKIGRTHLMDATPIRIGQVFGGYAAQIGSLYRDFGLVFEQIAVNLPIGGTAVGTGINTHPDFAKTVAKHLNTRLKFKKNTHGTLLREADEHVQRAIGEGHFRTGTRLSSRPSPSPSPRSPTTSATSAAGRGAGSSSCRCRPSSRAAALCPARSTPSSARA